MNVPLAKTPPWIEGHNCFGYGMTVQHSDAKPGFLFILNNLPIKSLIDGQITPTGERDTGSANMFAPGTDDDEVTG